MRPIKTKDTKRISRFLQDNTSAEVYETDVMKEIFSKSLGMLVTNTETKKIAGVLVGHHTEEYNCIMYFYMSEELRMKPIVRDMFKPFIRYFSNGMPIKIWSDDISTFSKRVVFVEDDDLGDHYEWIGGVL